MNAAAGTAFGQAVGVKPAADDKSDRPVSLSACSRNSYRVPAVSAPVVNVRSSAPNRTAAAAPAAPQTSSYAVAPSTASQVAVARSPSNETAGAAGAGSSTTSAGSDHSPTAAASPEPIRARTCTRCGRCRGTPCEAVVSAVSSSIE